MESKKGQKKATGCIQNKSWLTENTGKGAHSNRAHGNRAHSKGAHYTGKDT